MLAHLTHRLSVSESFDWIAFASVLFSLLLILAGVVKFYSDIKYIEGGVAVHPEEVTDPRIYMAAERTFLAWVRTAISLIVFGFVIEKFEFFLMQLEKFFGFRLTEEHHRLVGIGIFVILVGLVTLLIGAVNFYRTIKQVDRGFVYGLVIFLTCLVLTFYVLKVI